MKNLWISKNWNNLKNGFRMLTLKEKAVWLISIIIPLGFTAWGVAVTKGFWEHVFAASFVFITVLSAKILTKNGSDTRFTLVETGLYNSLISCIVILIWSLNCNILLNSSVNSALCNFSMGYIFSVIGCIAYAGLKEDSTYSKLGKVVFGLVITFLASFSIAIMYEGVDDLVNVPVWIDEAFYLLSHAGLVALITAIGLISVLISNIELENNIAAFRWCKRFGATTFALLTVNAASAYVCDLFNWGYNANIGIALGIGTFASFALCGLSSIIGHATVRRYSK